MISKYYQHPIMEFIGNNAVSGVYLAFNLPGTNHEKVQVETTDIAIVEDEDGYKLWLAFEAVAGENTMFFMALSSIEMFVVTDTPDMIFEDVPTDA